MDLSRTSKLGPVALSTLVGSQPQHPPPPPPPPVLAQPHAHLPAITAAAAAAAMYPGLPGLMFGLCGFESPAAAAALPMLPLPTLHFTPSQVAKVCDYRVQFLTGTLSEKDKWPK